MSPIPHDRVRLPSGEVIAVNSDPALGANMLARVRVRRLGPGDAPALAHLAAEDAAFDAEGRGAPRQPLGHPDAERYLSNPDVLHWVAEIDGIVVGHLLCYLEHRRSGEPRQLLLYEIGIRAGYRRRGIGSRLVEEMKGSMLRHGIRRVWVLADTQTLLRFISPPGSWPATTSR